MTQRLGFMYLAKRPCGRITAMAWDDPEYAKSTGKSVARWISRGDAVERIEVKKGDAIPDLICRKSEVCACRGDVPPIA